MYVTQGVAYLAAPLVVGGDQQLTVNEGSTTNRLLMT